MPPQRIIPLEPAGEQEAPPSLTDVVMALHLEALPHDLHEVDEREPLFEAEPLRGAARAAFGLGCAVGVEFPDKVAPLLRQTHDDAAEILDECREPLAAQAAQVRASGEAVTADAFLEDLLSVVEGDEAVERDVAYNVLSIAFEYGCILAVTERSAALVVRNAESRTLAEAAAAFEAGEAAQPPPAPDPLRPLRDFSLELVSAYETDFGALG